MPKRRGRKSAGKDKFGESKNGSAGASHDRNSRNRVLASGRATSIYFIWNCCPSERRDTSTRKYMQQRERLGCLAGLYENSNQQRDVRVSYLHDDEQAIRFDFSELYIALSVERGILKNVVGRMGSFRESEQRSELHQKRTRFHVQAGGSDNSNGSRGTEEIGRAGGHRNRLSRGGIIKHKKHSDHVVDFG